MTQPAAGAPLLAVDHVTSASQGRALDDLSSPSPTDHRHSRRERRRKSTIIKILLGLLRPTAGTARVLGMVAADSVAVRAQVGYMPEHDCLPSQVSAAEFLTHMAELSGLPPDMARTRAADMLRHAGLFEERYRPIGGYSTGMKQRVKLCQALVHDPAFVFLDEPTAGLDPTAARKCSPSFARRIASSGSACSSLHT